METVRINKPWTKEEIIYLKENYENNNISLKEIKNNLNRTKRAVCHKAIREGLTRDKTILNKKDKKINRDKYDKEYYKNNKTRIIESRREKINKIKEEMVNLLGGKCIKCSEDRIFCLDFHHKEAEIKEQEISKMLRKSSYSKLVEEVKKCELLCANCHREYHFLNPA